MNSFRADSPLNEALREVSIKQIWLHYDLDGPPGENVCSPFREDRKPSFSIFGDGTRWYDHATGEGGNQIDFIMKIEGCIRREACKILIKLHQGGLASRFRRTPKNSRKSPSPKTKKLRLPNLDAGLPVELAQLALSRKIDCIQGIKLLLERGILYFGYVDGVRCWIVCDQSRINAQARPVWTKQANWSMKAKILPGGSTSWPIGLADAQSRRIIYLCEGPPDMLAVTTAATLIYTKSEIDFVGFCCITGANARISKEALNLLERKSIVIVSHRDEAGQKAAKTWLRQIKEVTKKIFLWRSEKPGEDFNDALTAAFREGRLGEFCEQIKIEIL